MCIFLIFSYQEAGREITIWGVCLESQYEIHNKYERPRNLNPESKPIIIIYVKEIRNYFPK